MKAPGDSELIEALLAALGPCLERSPELRRLAAALGAWLIEQANCPRAHDAEHDPVPVPGPTPEPAPEPPAPLDPAPVVRQPTGPRAVVPLRIGDAETTVVVRGESGAILAAMAAADAHTPQWAETRSLDLRQIADRGQLKAASCGLAAELTRGGRQSQEFFGADNRVRALLDKAGAQRDCFLWAFYPGREQPDAPTLDRIGDWYGALGRAAALMVVVDESPVARRAEVEEAMQLLAWANSGLRGVLETTWLTRPDIDQDEAHAWLRWETQTRRVLVRRHMRLDDRAPTDSIGELSERLTELEAQITERARRANETRALLNRVRYHAGIMAAERSHDAAHDWDRIEEALGALASLGMKGSDDTVAAALEELAESEVQVPPACVLAAGALLAAREMVVATEDRGTESSQRRWSERVARARRLLEGRRLVVVGGEQRADASDRLTEAFGLSGVSWVELTEHGSGAAMRAPIAQPDTALVLVLVKLAGHLHVDDARRYAKAAGKPVVMLTAGYNPERVALAGLSQASAQLAAVAEPG